MHRTRGKTRANWGISTPINRYHDYHLTSINQWYSEVQACKIKCHNNKSYSMHATHLSHLHVSKMNMADSSFNFQIQRQFFPWIYHLSTLNMLKSSVMRLSSHKYSCQLINYACIYFIWLTLEIIFENANWTFNLTTFLVELIESSRS